MDKQINGKDGAVGKQKKEKFIDDRISKDVLRDSIAEARQQKENELETIEYSCPYREEHSVRKCAKNGLTKYRYNVRCRYIEQESGYNAGLPITYCKQCFLINSDKTKENNSFLKSVISNLLSIRIARKWAVPQNDFIKEDIDSAIQKKIALDGEDLCADDLVHAVNNGMPSETALQLVNKYFTDASKFSV